MYNSDGIPLKLEDVVDSMMAYWKRIFQKLNHDMKQKWILKEKDNYINKIRKK